MTRNLRAYLLLEKSMLLLDELGREDAADQVRDLMDPIWYDLSEKDRAFLDRRHLWETKTITVADGPASLLVPISEPHHLSETSPITVAMQSVLYEAA